MTQNNLILYSTEDGLSQFSLRKINGQVWLTPLDMADPYQTSKQNISKHIKFIIAEGKPAGKPSAAIPKPSVSTK